MQTDFDEVAVAYPGVHANSVRNQIRGYAAEDAVTEGKAVMRGTDPDRQVKLLTDRAKFVGIALKNSRDIEVNKMVDVLEEGSVYIYAKVAVVAGDPCYLYNDNTFGKVATDGQKIGYWITSTAKDALGIVEIIKA